MEVCRSIEDIQLRISALRDGGKKIAFVPTMGALHNGHMALAELGKQHADVVVFSIFVNPLQFGPNEGFDRYPRRLELDLKKCADAGVDLVFIPTEAELYPKGFSTTVIEDSVTKGLCGPSRPFYFKGSITLTVLYLNILRPDFLCLSEGDAQQIAAIKKVIRDLHFQVKVLTNNVSRDSDGLAYSSNHFMMTDAQRKEAIKIYQALQCGHNMVKEGMRNVDRVIAEVTHKLRQSLRLRVIYVMIVDKETMVPQREVIPEKSLLCLAIWLDDLRLIDNILL